MWRALLLVGSLAVGAAAQPTPGPSWDVAADTWSAVDDLGRVLPLGPDEARPAQQDRFVGMFYFAWLGNHTKELHDLTKILAANPEEPEYGPVGVFHHWGEPLFGYYFSEDEWVVAKHAHMLSAAGVDTIIFDVTNAFTYDKTVQQLCAVWSKLRELGHATPQIMFITHSSAAATVTRLYENFYEPGLYPELWFRWQGKPLVLWDGSELPAEVADFFTLRRSWAWANNPDGWFADGRDAWPWLDHHPQTPGWHTSPDEPEHISVSLAQHPVGNIGRSFHDGAQPADPPTDEGLCFAEQAARALEVDPQFVYVTGWNEWVAQRFLNEGGIHMMGRPLPRGGTFFVDCYNQEFSRDIEPMQGGHGDNYYWQLVDFVRHYKGVRPAPSASAAVTAPLRVADAGWDAVQPEFRAQHGLPAVRDAEGFGGLRYENRTQRAEFARAKLAYDAQTVYAWVECTQPIGPAAGDAWMNLLADTDGDPSNGWHGYDLLVNRQRDAQGRASIETWVGADWLLVGWAPLAVDGARLQVDLPWWAFGWTAGGPRRVDFKWTDNAGLPDQLEDWWWQGSVAPLGRFRYMWQPDL